MKWLANIIKRVIPPPPPTPGTFFDDEKDDIDRRLSAASAHLARLQKRDAEYQRFLDELRARRPPVRPDE